MGQIEQHLTTGMSLYENRHGEQWRDFLESDQGLRENIDSLRKAYRYVLRKRPLESNKDHRASITNAGLKLWSEGVHADILETILMEFKNHKNYKYLLKQLALYIGAFPEELEDKYKIITYRPERGMIRRLLRENGLEVPLERPRHY